MSDNGRRRIVSEMDEEMVTPLTNFFAALDMRWLSELVRALNPENEMMGVSTVTVSAASDAMRRWLETTPQARYMTAVLVSGVANGSFMQMPQDYMPNSAADAEWVADRLLQLNDEQRAYLQDRAIALVVAADSVMRAISEGLEGENDEQVH